MADAEKPDAPASQDAQPTGDASRPESASDATLEQARRFLRDAGVLSSSEDKKREFLRTKGISEDDIQKLLGEESSRVEEPAAKPEVATEVAREEPSETATQITTQAEPPAPTSSAPPVSASITSDAPPIITYPEFLTHSPRPPPLLTPSRLVNIVAASGAALGVLYGAASLVVSPMVDTLNESRSDYYDHLSTHLSKLVEKLEGMVSEVPYKNGKPLKSEAESDDNSSYDDPTEMFHRDIGTQTSPQQSLFAPEAEEKPIDRQARQLARLTASLKELSDTYTKQAESTADLHAVLREVRDEADKLAYPNTSDYYSSYGGYGLGRSSEPQDEVKKTKDAIRSVKGIFLSSRMFPTAATR